MLEKEKKYKVSILLAAYNTVDYISKCLDSIPIRDDVEIILIDDCSNDGTEIELLKYCHKNPNCKLIHNKENIGFALSKNVAYDIISGEYFTQLDSDDEYFTDVFEDIINNDLTADIVYFDMKVNSGKIWRSSPSTRFTIMDHCNLIKTELIGNIRCPNVSNGSGVYFNEEIQKELDKRNGTILYTYKVAYKYNWPREGSILDLKHKGLLK